jgi:hypothetical protein
VKNLFDLAAKLIGAILVLVVLYVNVSLYYRPEIKKIEDSEVNYDILQQLRHLRSEIDSGAATEMQNIYPEGFVFLHSLYALAWCDFLERVDQNSSLFKEGFNEVGKSCSRVNSEEGRSIFSEYQLLEYGAFYTGWSTYVLGRKLNLSKADVTDVKEFKHACERIAEFIGKSSSPYATSYYEMAWPGDMIPCVAALQLHDRMFVPTYQAVINVWITKVKSRLDEYGLVPHSVDSDTGKSVQSARGSSQSLMLIFLHDIDHSFARKQFRIYDSLFIGKRFGLTCVYEYPRGTWGVGDIDSGPVILGVGGAASIVGMRTLGMFEQEDKAISIRNGIESFGLSRRKENTKSYLFGTLPMADAFITWAQAGIKPATERSTTFLVFHIYSFLFASLISMLLFKPWRFFKKR